MKKEGKAILKGIAASSGIVTGTVKKINSPSETGKMKEGEIFVAPETTPEYILAMLKAAAIITDRGGILSHPAIVARELGIPGVVGTIKATQILKDGMEVTVDGNNGIVFSKNR